MPGVGSGGGGVFDPFDGGAIGLGDGMLGGPPPSALRVGGFVSTGPVLQAPSPAVNVSVSEVPSREASAAASPTPLIESFSALVESAIERIALKSMGTEKP